MSAVFGFQPTFSFVGPGPTPSPTLGQAFGNIVDFQPDVQGQQLDPIIRQLGTFTSTQPADFGTRQSERVEPIRDPIPTFANPFQTFTDQPLGGLQGFAPRTTQDILQIVGALNRDQLRNVDVNFANVQNQFQQAAAQLARAGQTPGFLEGTRPIQGATFTDAPTRQPGQFQAPPTVSGTRVPGTQSQFLTPGTTNIADTQAQLALAFEALLRRLGEERLL